MSKALCLLFVTAVTMATLLQDVLFVECRVVRAFIGNKNRTYGEGGLQNSREGKCDFTPTKRWRGGGGAEQVLAMLEGVQNKFWGSFFIEAWSFSHTQAGGTTCFHPLKRGGGHQ